MFLLAVIISTRGRLSLSCRLFPYVWNFSLKKKSISIRCSPAVCESAHSSSSKSKGFQWSWHSPLGEDTSSGSLLKRPQPLMSLSISSLSDITVNWPVPGDTTVMKSQILICSHLYSFLIRFSWCAASPATEQWYPITRASGSAFIFTYG